MTGQCGVQSGCLMQATSAVLVQAELKMSGITNIGMHNLSPGMVTTDLLMSGQQFCHHAFSLLNHLQYLPAVASCHHHSLH